jgi:hypothetical protein
MKTRMLILMSIFLLSVIFAFAGGKDRISKKDCWNALSGTWVNTEYLGTWDWYEQKVIIYPDGKFENYPLITDKIPKREGYYITITETWIDSEGVIWYKAKRTIPYELYDLGMINESGNSWEFISNPDTYPTEWDTSATRYPKYFHYYCQ